MMNATKKLLVITVLFSVLLMAYFAVAATKDYVSVNVINSTSNGIVYSTNAAGYINRTSLLYANFSTQSITLNISLLRNGSHGNYVNVTFGWQLAQSNGSFQRNDTVFNNTFNASSFNTSLFATSTLAEGIYNLSIFVENATTSDTDTWPFGVVNYSVAFQIAIDRTPPNVSSVVMNITNFVNFSSSSKPGKIEFNATVNDSTTYVTSVIFILLRVMALALT